MKNKFDWKIAYVAVSAILLIWLVYELVNKNKKIADLEKDIDSRKDINREIKLKLKKLIDEHSNELDGEVISEITEVLDLMNTQKESKAVLTLAKIIETLLKKLYQKSNILASIIKEKGTKRPTYSDYLEAAKRDKSITKEDFHLLSIVKVVRDKEAHELGVETNKEKMLSALICGIGVILTFSRKVKQSQVKNSH